MKFVKRKFVRFSQWVTIALLTVGLVGLFASLPASESIHFRSQTPLLQSLSPKAAVAQRFDVEGVWRLVYEALPDLPLENQYVSRNTGEVAEENTLVGRLIRYHVYVRGRPAIFRFDWKLTLGDYLGVNEPITPSVYPSADVLRVNPAEGDIAAIRTLNRAERDALVQVLVDIFNGGFAPSAPSPAPDRSEPVSPSPPATPGSSPALREPRPGDADLLRP
ncbi:hypothetical protein [Egbenema bharatensis]|uniref:hypothetical protein n=1 Tax=Egbenema bharatensis TaxID=3463334 RepID=UPI003A888E36